MEGLISTPVDKWGNHSRQTDPLFFVFGDDFGGYLCLRLHRFLFPPLPWVVAIARARIGLLSPLLAQYGATHFPFFLDQLISSQIAIVVGFLPAYILSGFLFEISSMPRWIQMLTYLLPAKYFVQSLQSLFLVEMFGLCY